MFKELRQPEKAISKDEITRILTDGEYGVLSTIGENGYAYGVPLNYTYFKDAIIFHCALGGNKIDNIAFNNKVSFCVIGKTQVIPDKFDFSYESVIIFGKVVEIHDTEKREAFLAFISKFSGEYLDKGTKVMEAKFSKTKIMKIEIEHITGKAGG